MLWLKCVFSSASLAGRIVQIAESKIQLTSAVCISESEVQTRSANSGRPFGHQEFCSSSDINPANNSEFHMIFVCWYIYILKYVYVYIYIIHLCSRIHTYIHTYVRTYVLTYLLTYLLTYIFTYLHTYILTYLHTYILTYIHTYIHTHIHIYIHVCRYVYVFRISHIS